MVALVVVTPFLLLLSLMGMQRVERWVARPALHSRDGENEAPVHPSGTTADGPATAHLTRDVTAPEQS